MTTPGWYQDQRFPGLMRWWDGENWTAHTQPAAGMLPPPAPVPMTAAPAPAPAPATRTRADPVRDLAEATRAGQVATRFVVVGALAYAVYFVASALNVRSFVLQVQDWYDGPRRSDGSLPALTLHGVATYTAIANACSAVALVVLIMLLIWVHKAASMAVRLGLPARRSPAWAVAGFLLPIVNFWFPYRSALDMFPAGHSGRSMVVRWWALWVASLVAALGMYGAAWVSQGFAVAVAVAAALLYAGSAVVLVRLIKEVTVCHAALIATR